MNIKIKDKRPKQKPIKYVVDVPIGHVFTGKFSGNKYMRIQSDDNTYINHRYPCSAIRLDHKCYYVGFRESTEIGSYLGQITDIEFTLKQKT